jgi:hypothetical protein
MDQYGQPMTDSGGTMDIYENVAGMYYGPEGSGPFSEFGSIGPSNYPGTSSTANSSGQFIDAPFGGYNIFGPFSVNMSQTIYVAYQGNFYPVATTFWNFSSSSMPSVGYKGAGIGSISGTNGVSF